MLRFPVLPRYRNRARICRDTCSRRSRQHVHGCVCQPYAGRPPAHSWHCQEQPEIPRLGGAAMTFRERILTWDIIGRTRTWFTVSSVIIVIGIVAMIVNTCLLYTSPSPRD